MMLKTETNTIPIKSYRSSKVQVKTSSLKGRGIFAIEPIVKGEIVFIKAGQILNYEEAIESEQRFGDYCLQIHDNFYLGPKTEEELENTSIYANHSCEPNIGPEGQITFVALRDILPGEELCHDYAMTTMRNYTLECKCRSKNCRGVITGNDWKKVELQIKYGNNFMHFILKRIAKQTSNSVEQDVKL